MNFVTNSAEEEQTAEINITPLVDIVFLLLIFFMVSTTFDESQAIKVKLPSASSSAAESAPKDLTVSIRSNGNIFVNRERVQLEELPSKMKSFGGPKSQTVLVLRADEKVDHGQVVHVMDIARTAGVKKIAVATLAGASTPK